MRGMLSRAWRSDTAGLPLGRPAPSDSNRRSLFSFALPGKQMHTQGVAASRKSVCSPFCQWSIRSSRVVIGSDRVADRLLEVLLPMPSPQLHIGTAKRANRHTQCRNGGAESGSRNLINGLPLDSGIFLVAHDLLLPDWWSRLRNSVVHLHCLRQIVMID